jgi:hypothetical protein
MVRAPKKIVPASVAASETATGKPWYASRTIWLGILSVVAAVVTSLATLNPMITSAILAGIGAAIIAIRATESGGAK